MATPPWAEGPYKVIVEFKRSGEGVHRKIKLGHTPDVVPPQLQGRVSPDAWRSFMQDAERLAESHPYVVPPGAGRVASWFGAAIVGAVVGFCCFNPDGGDYSRWLPELHALVDRHQAAFNAGGVRLSVQHAQFSYWVQADVDLSLAVGLPVAAPHK